MTEAPIGLRFNRESAFPRRWTGTVFRLAHVQLPGSGLVVGGLGDAAEDES
jgi:hypothetical protein